jgi:hypothetical protein
MRALLQRHRATAWLLAALAATILAGCGGATSASRPSGASASARTRERAKPPPVHRLQGARAAFYRNSTAMLASVVELLAARAPGKPTYFDSGLWHSKPLCWTCDLVPGEVAAIVSRAYPADPRFRSWAIETIDRAIRDYRRPGGSFGVPGERSATNEIPTIWTVNAIATTYIELRNLLPPATRARWRQAIAGAANWLAPNVTYYVNGNINLSLTLALYLAARITGERSLNAAYRTSWSFTLHPRGSQWVGFGLHLTRRPRRRDGSDGAGYLAEARPKKPGFDPHYTGVQAATAAELFAISRRPGALRLLNLLTNELLARTNRRTLVITNGTGTRRVKSEGQGRFESPAIPVLALIGGRTDLIGLVSRQLTLSGADFRNYVRSGNDQNSVIGDYAWATLAAQP